MLINSKFRESTKNLEASIEKNEDILRIIETSIENNLDKESIKTLIKEEYNKKKGFPDGKFFILKWIFFFLFRLC